MWVWPHFSEVTVWLLLTETYGVELGSGAEDSVTSGGRGGGVEGLIGAQADLCWGLLSEQCF